jgi:hypothetical protein
MFTQKDERKGPPAGNKARSARSAPEMKAARERPGLPACTAGMLYVHVTCLMHDKTFGIRHSNRSRAHHAFTARSLP